MVGPMHQVLMDRPAAGDVLHLADRVLHGAVLRADVRDSDGRPHLAPIGPEVSLLPLVALNLAGKQPPQALLVLADIVRMCHVVDRHTQDLVGRPPENPAEGRIHPDVPAVVALVQ